MNCYRCGVELTPINHSPEHIIQRAIGGTIVSWELLCRPCNGIFGREVDGPFVRFTSYLYRLVLQARPTSRADDSLTGVIASGKKIRFGPNMVPDTEVYVNLPDGEKLSFTVPAAKAEEKAVKKLGKLLDKYTHIDIQRVITNAKTGHIRVDELVYFTNFDTKNSMMGSPPFFCGIKKIAVNFYLSKGHAQHYVQDIINQVKEGKGAARKISTFYYPQSYSIHDLSAQEISHVIKLVGNPDLGVLYFYIELFNVAHTLILLNRYYYGPALDEQFCYDVLAGVELRKPINLHFDNRDLMLGIFDYDWHTNPQGEAVYARTRGIINDLLRAKGLLK